MKSRRGRKAKEMPSTLAAQAAQAHAELTFAGIPARSQDGRSYTLIERMRLLAPTILYSERG